MRTFVIAVLVLLGLSYTDACNNVAVQKCFEDMGKSLGLQNNQVGTQLFTLVNPGNENIQQEQTCSALKGYDFNSVKTCITAAGCSSTSILPADMAGSPNQPVITWTNIIEMLEGICKPGCEKLASMNKDAEKCSQKIQENQGSDPCSALDKAFDCFRKVIGRCEVLVSFTESILETSGVMNMAKQQCPDLNLSLNSGKMATASIVSTLAMALIAMMVRFS